MKTLSAKETVFVGVGPTYAKIMEKEKNSQNANQRILYRAKTPRTPSSGGVSEIFTDTGYRTERPQASFLKSFHLLL
eukprot:UN11485